MTDTAQNDPSDFPEYVEEIKASVSGVKPATIFASCAGPGRHLAAEEQDDGTDAVYLTMERGVDPNKREGHWSITRATCEEHHCACEDSMPHVTEASVRAEVMRTVQTAHGTQYVLGNPEVLDLSPEEEARGESAKVLSG